MATAVARLRLSSSPTESEKSVVSGASTVTLIPRRLAAAASRPVAADSVVAFRVLFGLVVAFGALRFLAKGWVDSLYLAPLNHLSYPGFGWVHPLPAPWMHVHLLLLAVLGLAIAVGYRYRLTTVLFLVGFVYVELIDAALYLNHYWFVTLVAAALVVLPLHRHCSVDARAGRVGASATVPALTLWVLRGQVAVVYVFAGIAKLNADWLFEALPMRLWLADNADLPLIGPLLAMPLVAYLASWAGAFFDCTIVGWLLWQRSRPLAYLAVVVFHMATALLFRIGIFPMLMIFATLVFFSPDWPRRLIARFAPNADVRVHTPMPTGIPEARVGNCDTSRRWSVALVALAFVAIVELALPLRHLAYPNNVRWTEEGYMFAWRVMLTEKTGHVNFRVRAADGSEWEVGPELVLTDWQTAQATIRPDLLVATAHLIADHYRSSGRGNVEVRADAFVSFNGRPHQRLVDPSVDLAAQSRSLTPKDYLLPLNPPQRN